MGVIADFCGQGDGCSGSGRHPSRRECTHAGMHDWLAGMGPNKSVLAAGHCCRAEACLGAGLGERAGNGSAHAASGAGHECHLAAQVK